jgi:catechol 2,3-dioxygenase-like lactoylglutathione lyase family enzyme
MSKQWLLLLLVLSSSLVARGQATHRPRITGIDHASFYTTAPDANAHVYSAVLGLASVAPIEPRETQRFLVGTQWVGYSPAPDPKATDRMDHVAFTTDDVSALRSYLASKGVAAPTAIRQLSDGSHRFEVKDPEGNVIEFVERPKSQTLPKSPSEAVSRRMIHVGFIVRDRDTENHFYRDILGFRPYWHGGMKPGATDWVAMQVPDGTDWLEYMLNIPPHPGLQTTGVMNHISLGVVDMKQAQATIEAHGWDPHGDQHMQMGKDGKWQLNLFDPDLSRIELMEFKPVEKPCCSEFTAPHPQAE